MPGMHYVSQFSQQPYKVGVKLHLLLAEDPGWRRLSSSLIDGTVISSCSPAPPMRRVYIPAHCHVTGGTSPVGRTHGCPTQRCTWPHGFLCLTDSEMFKPISCFPQFPCPFSLPWDGVFPKWLLFEPGSLTRRGLSRPAGNRRHRWATWAWDHYLFFRKSQQYGLFLLPQPNPVKAG